jgi:predicted transcriptional regulator
MNDHNIVLDRIKVMNVINILEPVSITDLVTALNNNVDPDLLTSIIEELHNSGFISIDKEYYRVTRRGLSFYLSRESKTLRDVYRMNYLVNTTKAKGR